MKIRRGTDKDIKFSTPYESAQVASGCVSFAQRGTVVIDKKIGSEGVTIGDYSLTVSLTEKETLSLTEVDKCKIQGRFRLDNGKKRASNILVAEVEGILKDGELE